MSKESTTIQVGPGLAGLTFLVLLTLKLCGAITISWWWVTCPLWAGLAISILIFLVVVAIGFVLGVVVAILERNRSL
jgi:ABC-type amino acid transport system permease subunit